MSMFVRKQVKTVTYTVELLGFEQNFTRIHGYTAFSKVPKKEKVQMG